MSTSKHWLDLERVTPGMTLSEDVRDPKGDVLLPQGTALTASMLATLGRRGVQSLPISGAGTGEGDGDGAARDPETRAQREQILRRIERQFRKTGNDSANSVLRHLLMDYRGV